MYYIIATGLVCLAAVLGMIVGYSSGQKAERDLHG